MAKTSGIPATYGQAVPTDAHDGGMLCYGLNAQGRLLHVSEVSSGLVCDCRCPGCGDPLMARKGPVLAHHFAHRGDHACGGARETALHLLAKRVVLEARGIYLPGVKAKPSLPIFFRYENAETEVDLGGIRPDAVISRGNHRLMLEFKVTHGCDADKISLIEKGQLSCVEIDLSNVLRLDSLDRHTESILRTAPRKWIHNAKEASKKKAFSYRKTANEIAQVWHSPIESNKPIWDHIERVVSERGFGHPYYFLYAIPGSRCFSAAPRAWQSALIQRGLDGGPGGNLSAEYGLCTLQGLGMLKDPPFLRRRDWPDDLVAHIRTQIPDFRSPLDVISDYIAHLASRGITA